MVSDYDRAGDLAPRDRASRESSSPNLEELGGIAAELLHDLGGVLSVLAGRVSLAREQAALGRVPADELVRIQSDADELRRMVLEILEELQPRPRSLEVTFPVTSTVEEVINRWLVGASAISVTLHSTIPPEAEIRGPKSFFSRSLGNLLRNAARYARREVRISMKMDSGRDAVRIRLEDDGPGISPIVRERVFDPFVSSSSEGFGLGLSFARWGIDRLGGRLQLEDEISDLGGASFAIDLPLASFGSRNRTAARSGRHDDPERPVESEVMRGIRIAIVDDEPPVRSTFARLLRRAGANAIEVDSTHWVGVEDAVRALRQLNPHVILLDVDLQGLSGAEVERALTRLDPEFADRILFLTGGAVEVDSLDRPLINKMTHWDELIARIRRAVLTTDGG